MVAAASVPRGAAGAAASDGGGAWLKTRSQLGPASCRNDSTHFLYSSALWSTAVGGVAATAPVGRTAATAAAGIGVVAARAARGGRRWTFALSGIPGQKGERGQNGERGQTKAAMGGGGWGTKTPYPQRGCRT